MHTTNYTDTLITVAPDTKATKGQVPAQRAASACRMFAMIANHPYRFTSDDVIYASHVAAKGPTALSRDEFFSKGQACLRSSTLAKTLGWGIHFNAEGRIALYGVESSDYRNLVKTQRVKAALRSSRKNGDG